MAAAGGDPKLPPGQRSLYVALKERPEEFKAQEWLTRATGLDGEELQRAMNALLAGNHIELAQGRAGVQCRLRDPAAAAKHKGLGNEDLLVLQAITRAGNNGIWTKDMKRTTGLQQPQITKILKGLEARKLVKSVKSVDSASKKIYMLFELEPSASLSGGAWYTDNEFDKEYIEILQRLCLKFVQEAPGGRISLLGIADAIKRSGISKQELSTEDAYTLMRALDHDGVVEGVPESGEGPQRCYRLARMPPPRADVLTAAPCGACPVKDECGEGGPISPQRCVYFQQWLSF